MNTSTTKNHATANVGKKEAGIIIDIVSKPYDIPPGFEFITANNRVKSINFEQLCASQPIKGHKNMTGLQTLKKVASKKLCPSNLMDSIASLSVQFVLDSKRIKTLEELETIYLVFGADILWDKDLPKNNLKNGKWPILVVTKIGKEYLVEPNTKALSEKFNKSYYFIEIKSMPKRFKKNV